MKVARLPRTNNNTRKSQTSSIKAEHRLGWLISGFAATVHPLPLPILSARTREVQTQKDSHEQHEACVLEILPFSLITIITEQPCRVREFIGREITWPDGVQQRLGEVVTIPPRRDAFIFAKTTKNAPFEWALCRATG